MAPLGEIGEEVAQRRLGVRYELNFSFHEPHPALKAGAHVLERALDVPVHVERVAWRFWYSESIEDGHTSRQSAGENAQAPHIVQDQVFARLVVVNDHVPESGEYRNGDESAHHNAEALHGEHGGYHRSATLSRGELARDDCREREVAANADAEQEAPQDEHVEYAVGWVKRAYAATQTRGGSREDDYDELNAIQSLSAVSIGQKSENDLAHQRADLT